MIRLRIQECSFCILVIVFYFIFPLIVEGSVEDTLAKLNAKSSGERQELTLIRQ